MANLPDLDTGNIGIISYWCAHDYRATAGATIDPTDVIDILDSYTIYDNGVDGTYSKDPRTVNVRVKNDGWIIAWIDRTNQYAQNIAQGNWHYNGYYDILLNWKDADSNISSDTTTLIETVADLYNDLSNLGDFDFYKEDVGNFCYEFPDASTFTLASTFPPSNEHGYVTITITSGTILYYLVPVGSSISGGWAEWQYDSTSIASDLGAYDVVANDAYERDTALSLDAFDDASVTAPGSGALLVIWA